LPVARNPGTRHILKPAQLQSGKEFTTRSPKHPAAHSIVLGAIVTAILAGAANGRAGDADTRFDGKPYKVYPDGKVNFASYRGQNLYGGNCLVCHGDSGLGSSFAPSLVESLKVLSYADFIAVVLKGRENITSSSNSVMPPYGDNPTISKYIDSIYAYLKGRADGAIPKGNVEYAGPKDE
jgi:mono/diheme cytochrome c family protein